MKLKENEDLSLRLTQEQFKIISKIAYSEAGLVLVDSKAAMIAARLSKRVRKLNMKNFDTYFDALLHGERENELPHLISALTTNVSHFFREEHHYEILRKTIIPDLKKRALDGEKIRIWSAGCSNGQELYSIAITLNEEFEGFDRHDIKLLGTDIDPTVVKTAREGVYSTSQIKGIPTNLQKKYFSERKDSNVEIHDKLKNQVSFKNLNLISDWPMKFKFDVIFCRNVVIYFDEETQSKLWLRFNDVMKSGAWLMLGHSERIQNLSDTNFINSGVTAYRKSLS